MGIKWEVIDFENKKLEIKRAVAETINRNTCKLELTIDKPKSEFCERAIYIPQDVFELISKLPLTITVGKNVHKKRQGEAIEMEYVFHNSQGEVCKSRTWSRRHYKVFMSEMKVPENN